MANDNVYFAAKPAEDTAQVLTQRSEDWFQTLDTSGYLDKIRTSWLAYHGNFFENNGESHTISFGGEQGELTQIGVNHYRNIAQHTINMITAARPMMEARAINSDQKSLVQAQLANGILDYYMRDHRLENYFKNAVESAVVFGVGYIKMEWNSTRGELFDYNEDLGIEIREGDLEFTNLSPFDVMFDTHREDRKHDWVICRSFKNRFDLAAKYPELEEQILALPTKDQILKFSTFTYSYDDTDLVPVYEFYHRRTESMPDGRYLLYLDGETVLLDSPMPYRDLPVYAIAPGYFLGTAYGYTPMFDLLPLQDAVNSLYSTILTNQTAFGVQNIVVPKAADVSIQQLSGGLNMIEANLQGGARIEPLNLTQTPKEIFEYLQMLIKDMETISGINQVARGNPDPNLRSGNAMALIQSMALQFMSGLQQSYVMLIEDVGTGIINILKDHANVPRVATIVGKNKRSFIKEFKGDDLDAVNRVVVDIGNPLARTTAGKLEMAEQLLQMQAITTYQEYIQVIQTGQLDVMTEDTTSQLNLVRGENERMMEGGTVVAIFTDDHALHIKDHSAILNDPELRLDADLVQRVTAHIQEHIGLLQTTDPNILNMLGQTPIAPPQPPMSPQGPGPQGPPPDQLMAPQGPGPDMGGMMTPTVMEQTGGVMGPLPSPAQVDPSLLPNPELQAMSLGNVRQN